MPSTFGPSPRVVVVGAGAGGLAASVDLAVAGCDVTLVDRHGWAGGKLRAVEVAGATVDAGPTVLTMRWVFERLFADAGENLGSFVRLEQAEVLARHAWADGARLDLHADPLRTRDAIGAAFGAREAAGYDRFREETSRLYAALERTFIHAERPGARGMLALARAVGGAGLGTIAMRSMWSALARHFSDPRLMQLFGRYATYCGSSPLHAPATLNVVAHVESLGVHRVRGGMQALASALGRLAAARGVRVVLGRGVERILVEGGHAAGVRLQGGETLAADAVVHAGDVSALGALLGVRRPTETPRAARSFSAVTWAIVGEASGFPLVHHNVFFSDDYPAELDALARGAMPEAPTVYACAQDRADTPAALPTERLLLIVNAPATGDEPARWTPQETERWQQATFSSMKRCGLDVRPIASRPTTPEDFQRLFPATGGALYGPATHGPIAALRRMGSRGPLPGLYLAGGSVHPGPGVPMATLSGRLAASRLIADLASTRTSSPAAIAGTTSTA